MPLGGTRQTLALLVAWWAIAIAPIDLLRGDEPNAAAPPADASLVTPSTGDAPQFQRDVIPILTAHCFKCHGNESAKAELDLRSVNLMVRGGASGTAIVPGKSAESLLHERIADRSMPPEGELALTDDKIETIRRWIEAGAIAGNADGAAEPIAVSPIRPDAREFWAFRPLSNPAVPAVRDVAAVRTPVDSFIQARLELESLQPMPEADRRTLARRLSFDLRGLPPSPDEVAAFLDDSTPQAYERFVDMLLASPHFGERWGRYWLDVGGYVDTIGDDTDAPTAKVAAGKWRYRDYVVGAFNQDKPFDRFLVEQIAGDELVDWRGVESFSPETLDLLIATGYLRSAADETLQNELNTADIRHIVLARTMEVTLSGLLGLTVQCARCHSHKYDPIPQEDYYRLLAIFAPAFNPQTWLQPAQRELADVSPLARKKLEQTIAELDKQAAEVEAKISELKKPFREQLFTAKLATLPEAIRADVKAAIETLSKDRNEVQRYLAEKFEGSLKIKPEEIDAALSETDRAQVQELQTKIAAIKGQKPTWGTIQAVYDVGPPPPFYLLRRGNHETPGAAVEPGFLRVLCSTDAEALISPTTPGASSSEVKPSGRRLALARWLTASDSPASALVARNWVNRVWQQLFGEGIVATSDNFGQSGTEPSNPELLDWIARDFVSSGWRTKPLIKQLVMSAAYRRASKAPPSADQADAGDTLWWRTRLRQLDAEIVRDAILAVSGQLDRTLGGPPVMTESRHDGTVVIKANEESPDEDRNRRSMYLLCRRRYHLTMLEVFDQPEVATNCTRRAPSAVVSQSLALLNDPFVAEQADALAERVRLESSGTDTTSRITHAFELALIRPPSDEELAWATELVERQAARYRAASMNEADAARKALAHLCHALYSTNEFLYVE